MWRWIGLACLVYGLSSLGLMLGPHRPQPGGKPLLPGFEPGRGGPPSAIDFERPFPPPVTRPPSETVVTEQSSGNHVMEWRLPPDGERMHSLALPLKPLPGASSLVLELGANREQELRIGLREQDGSLYLVPRHASMATIQQRVGLTELRLGAMTQDENGRLDPDQVTAVVLVSPEPPLWRGTPALLVITLDNLRFE